MCAHGDTVLLLVTIPARLSHTGHRRLALEPVDRCIAPIVRALNREGIITVSSCCAHGKGPGVIALEDGRLLEIA